MTRVIRDTSVKTPPGNMAPMADRAPTPVHTESILCTHTHIHNLILEMSKYLIRNTAVWVHMQYEDMYATGVYRDILICKIYVET